MPAVLSNVRFIKWADYLLYLVAIDLDSDFLRSFHLPRLLGRFDGYARLGVRFALTSRLRRFYLMVKLMYSDFIHFQQD